MVVVVVVGLVALIVATTGDMAEGMEVEAEVEVEVDMVGAMVVATAAGEAACAAK